MIETVIAAALPTAPYIFAGFVVAGLCTYAAFVIYEWWDS